MFVKMRNELRNSVAPGNQIDSLLAITGLFRSGIIWMQSDYPGNQIVWKMAITGLFCSGIIWMQTDYPWRTLVNVGI
jgi:hypothetical protein